MTALPWRAACPYTLTEMTESKMRCTHCAGPVGLELNCNYCGTLNRSQVDVPEAYDNHIAAAGVGNIFGCPIVTSDTRGMKAQDPEKTFLAIWYENGKFDRVLGTWKECTAFICDYHPAAKSIQFFEVGRVHEVVMRHTIHSSP
jgi:hypothetical protein